MKHQVPNSEAEEMLNAMGAAWFIAYTYYKRKLKELSKWEKAKVDVFNKSKAYHKEYIRAVAEMREKKLEKEELPLSGAEILRMAGELQRQKRVSKALRDKFREMVTRLKDEGLVRELCNIKYSKKTFGIPYAMLLPVSEKTWSKKLHMWYDEEPVVAFGKGYRVCKEWYGKNMESIERWMKMREERGDLEQRKPKGGEKIGEIVQGRFRDMLAEIHDRRLVENLCDKEYSQALFGLSYAVLMPAGGAEGGGKRHVSYYVDPVRILGKEYRICNNWYEKRNRKKLERWIQKRSGERIS